MEANGNVRTLTINKTNLSDDAAYECVVGEDKSFTEVFVKGAPSLFFFVFVRSAVLPQSDMTKNSDY